MSEKYFFKQTPTGRVNLEPMFKIVTEGTPIQPKISKVLIRNS